MRSKRSAARALPAAALALSCLVVVGLALAGCGTPSAAVPVGTPIGTVAPAGTAAPTATPPPAAVAGQGFRLTLPAGWTASGPSTADGYTTYTLQSATAGVVVTVATLPIPNDPTNPQVAAVMKDDIATLALTINGTTGAQPHVVEPAHVVKFAGESCARMGLVTASGGDSRSITCRRNRVISVVSVIGPSSMSAQLLPTLDAMAAAWTWVQ